MFPTSTSAALLTSDGAEKNGRFLVRKRAPTGSDLVLSLVFRGKPTQHLITKDDNGHLVMNKKLYGEHSDIDSVSVSVDRIEIGAGCRAMFPANSLR